MEAGPCQDGALDSKRICFSIPPRLLTVLLSAIKGNHFLLIFAEIENDMRCTECCERGISVVPKLAGSQSHGFIGETFSSEGATRAASSTEQSGMSYLELGFSLPEERDGVLSIGALRLLSASVARYRSTVWHLHAQ